MLKQNIWFREIIPELFGGSLVEGWVIWFESTYREQNFIDVAEMGQRIPHLIPTSERSSFHIEVSDVVITPTNEDQNVIVQVQPEVFIAKPILASQSLTVSVGERVGLSLDFHFDGLLFRSYGEAAAYYMQKLMEVEDVPNSI